MTDNELQRKIIEAKSLIRHVRTARGVKKYGQPIGSVIVPDVHSFDLRSVKRKREHTSHDSNAAPVTLARNSTEVPPVQDTERAIRVAPDPDPIEDLEHEPVGKPLTSTHQLFSNSAPMLEVLDWNLMKKGTTKDGLARLDELGVNYDFAPAFARNRSFVVGAAATLDAFENIFPGFVKRHGNLFTDARYNISKGLPKGSGALAYNTVVANHGDGKLDPDYAVLFPRQRLDLLEDGVTPGRKTNQTFTAATELVLSPNVGSNYLRSATPDEHGEAFNSNGPFMQEAMKRGVNKNTAAVMAILAHEFSHGIASSINGHLSFDLHGAEDKGTHKRRWYTEYYNNARLDFYEKLGIAKRTGKKVDATALGISVDRQSGKHVAPSPFTKEQEKIVSDADLSTPEKAKEFFRLIALYKKWREENNPDNYHHASLGTGNRPLPDYIHLDQKHGYLEDVDPDVGAIREALYISQYGGYKWPEFEAEALSAFLLSPATTKAALMWAPLMADMFDWWLDDSYALDEETEN